VPDNPKLPTQTDEDEDWSPKGDPDWHEIDVYGNNGKTRNRPNKMEWDPLKPKTNGMIITHQDSTNLFRVMCGGMTYEINWDNCWPPLPVPVDKKSLPTGSCEPYKAKQTVVTGVSDVKYNIYYNQGKCSLQINCVMNYTVTKIDFSCTGDPQYWHKGIAYKQNVSKTRANYFTCPCGDK